MSAHYQSKLTHADAAGMPRLVDVSDKSVTRRTATAQGTLRMSSAAARTIVEDTNAKGSVVAVATVAAINGAKHTFELLPLCHNLVLDRVDVNFSVVAHGEVACRVTVSTEARTGVEMEALVAVQVGLLTVYDMCKAIDQGMEFTGSKLVEKTGGKADYLAG